MNGWAWASIPATAIYLLGTAELGRWLRKSAGFLLPDLPWAAGFDLLMGLGLISGSLVVIGRYTSALGLVSLIWGLSLLGLGLLCAVRCCRASISKASFSGSPTSILLGLAAMYASILILAALCPPTKPDELFYKVPFIERALQDLAFLTYETPWAALQPLASQVFVLPLLFLGFTAAAGLSSLMALGALGVVLLLETERRYSEQKPFSASVASAVLLLLTPWAVVWGIAPGNDTWSALSLAVATCFAFECLRAPRWFPAFALTGAVAITIKSGSIIALAAMGVFLGTRLAAQRKFRVIITGAVGAFFVLLPFFLRTYSDWGVFTPDPIYCAARMKGLDGQAILRAVHDNVQFFTYWPRSWRGFLQAPRWLLTHHYGLLNITVGPALWLFLFLSAKRLDRGFWALMLFTGAVCAWSLTYMLPQFPRYFAGVALGFSFILFIRSFPLPSRLTAILSWSAAAYVVALFVFSIHYLNPYVRFALGREDIAHFLTANVQAAEARLFLLTQGRAGGKILTNLTDGLYTDSPIQTLAEQGGSILGRSEKTFQSSRELKRFLVSKGYTRILWARPGNRLWEDLFSHSTLVYDQDNAAVTGGARVAARGRVRIFAL